MIVSPYTVEGDLERRLRRPMIYQQPDWLHPRLEGLTGWYRFAENTENQTLDYSPYQRHATSVNFGMVTDSQVGHVADFDANGRNVTLPGSNPQVILNNGNDYTIMAWSRWSSGVGAPGHGSGWGAYGLVADTGDWMTLGVQKNSSNVDSFIYYSYDGSENKAYVPMIKGEWVQLAMVHRGGTVHCFLNGVEEASYSSGRLSGGGTLKIGSGSSNGEYYRGRVSEVRFYGRALSNADIDSLFQVPFLEFEETLYFGTSASGETLTPAAITSEETIPSPSLSVGAATVAPTAIGPDESIPSPTVNPGSLSVGPSAVNSEEALSSPGVSVGVVTISPSGIISQEIFGTPILVTGSITLSPSSVIGAEAFGSAVLNTGALSILPSAIGSGEGLGGLTLVPGAITLPPSSIESEESVLTPVLSVGGVMLTPSSIGSDEAHGVTVLAQEGSLAVSGIPSAEVIGTLQIIPGSISIAPSGIITAEVVGSIAVAVGAQTLLLNGVITEEAHGTLSLTVGATTISVTAIDGEEAFGLPSLAGPSSFIAIQTHTAREGVVFTHPARSNVVFVYPARTL